MRYLFILDFSKLNSEAILMALSDSFFTLSVGITIMIAYGSYVKKDQNLGSITASVALADTVIALLASIVIFPIVFTAGLDTQSGPRLLFVTLPTGLAIAGIVRVIVCSLIFFLMIMAVLYSAISLLVVITSYFTDKGYNRMKVSFIVVRFIMILAYICSLSQGVLS